MTSNNAAAESVNEPKAVEEFAVTCPQHGRQELTLFEYWGQLGTDHWTCPDCGRISQWAGNA